MTSAKPELVASRLTSSRSSMVRTTAKEAASRKLIFTRGLFLELLPAAITSSRVSTSICLPSGVTDIQRNCLGESKTSFSENCESTRYNWLSLRKRNWPDPRLQRYRRESCRYQSASRTICPLGISSTAAWMNRSSWLAEQPGCRVKSFLGLKVNSTWDGSMKSRVIFDPPDRRTDSESPL